jgi:peptidyl-prolyl cis-trans isomerase SurA
MMRSVVLMLFCSVMIVPAFAQSKKQKKTNAPKSITVFSVNGNPVTAAEFIYLYRKNHQNKTEDYTPEKIQEYLDLFVNFKLKVEEARKRGMDTTAAFAKEFQQYKEELRKPYLPDATLTDSLVKLTYNRMKEEVKAAHILINVKPDASPEDTLKAYTRIREIRSKILAGEDFGTAAEQYSEDPSAKTNKGNLGYFTAMQMVFAFENAAFQTKKGEISQPVRTRFGYHLVKVIDRRPAQGEVEVAHIMLRTGEEKDAVKVKNAIFEIYDKLQAGVKWEELCKEFSEDPGSKENGGKLRPFGVGAMANVPEFERMAFSLRQPGDISDPFQTQYGWHIMKLERKIPLQPFEEMSSSLKSRVTRDERTQVSKQAMQAKLRKEFLFTENAAAKAKVIATADSSLQKATWKAPVFPRTEKEPLFTLLGKNYTASDFLAYAEKHQRPNTLAPGKYMEQVYNNYVDACILDKQEEKIVRENPEYSFLVKEYYEGILLFEIMEREVWNKASADSVGQVHYFEAHTADYQAGERVKAALYSSAAAADLEALRPAVQKADEAKIQEMVSAKRIKSESGFYKKDDKAVLGKISWTEGVHSAENNGMYYLAWLKNILPPGPMSFEEARPAVISDYQTYLEKSWIEGLKKKYPVKVNEKGKQYILQQLKK